MHSRLASLFTEFTDNQMPLNICRTRLLQISTQGTTYATIGPSEDTLQVRTVAEIRVIRRPRVLVH